MVTGNGKSWIVRASFDVCLQGLDFEMIALPTFWTFWGFAMPVIIELGHLTIFIFKSKYPDAYQFQPS